MRTITPDPARQVPASAPATRRRTTVSTDALIETIVGDLHEMIGSLRCAGTGRMVKAGISMTHLHILWVLEHHGDLTMSRLADLLDVSLSNATGLIDRMAERGLIDRIRDEIEALKQDRLRSVLTRLSPAKLERVLGAIADLRGAVVDEIGPDHLGDHVHHASTAPQA